MLSYKVILVVVALAFGGGVCSIFAVHYFFPEEEKVEAAENPEDARRDQMLAKYCDFYKDSKTPFPGCE